MDTLFTTFLSPGMAPSVWPLDDTLLGNCLVDVTNWVSSKYEFMDSKVVSGDQFVKGLSKKKGSDWWNELTDMYIETPYIMYFQSFPKESRFSSSYPDKKSSSDILFNEYFRHQNHHKAVNQRLQTTLLTIFDCCLQLGTLHRSLEEENIKKGHCCQNECSTMTPEQNKKPLVDCPCDKQETGDRYCETHDLFIQDMITAKNTCAWNIYLSAIGSELQDDYFVNPCYNELCENLLDDSFEIEFSTTTADELETSFESIDFANIHLACDAFDGGGDDFFDVYDDDEDCDDYDESGLCEIFNSELRIAPTWSNDVIIARSSSRQINNSRGFRRDYLNTKRESSQYHTQCTSHRKNSFVSANSKRTGNVNKDLVDGKVKKRVHFPEPDRLVTVHRLVAWPHAYRQSRRSEWLTYAKDRAHFRRRIMMLSDIIEPVLKQKVSQFDRKS